METIREWREKMGEMATWPTYCPWKETLDQFWSRLYEWMNRHPDACCGWSLVPACTVAARQGREEGK